MPTSAADAPPTPGNPLAVPGAPTGNAATGGGATSAAPAPMFNTPTRNDREHAAPGVV